GLPGSHGPSDRRTLGSDGELIVNLRRGLGLSAHIAPGVIAAAPAGPRLAPSVRFAAAPAQQHMAPAARSSRLRLGRAWRSRRDRPARAAPSLDPTPTGRTPRAPDHGTAGRARAQGIPGSHGPSDRRTLASDGELIVNRTAAAPAWPRMAPPARSSPPWPSSRMASTARSRRPRLG